MSKGIISQLKKIKNYDGRVNPDHDWVVSNREIMMKQISNTVQEARPAFNFNMVWQGLSVFVPGRFVYAVVRPLLVFLVVGAVATSGWIASVSATQDCLPGDICYGVKMAVEKTQQIVVSVTGSEEEEAQLHLEFASRRAKEAKKVVAKKDDVEALQKAQVAIKKLEKSLQSAKKSLKKVSQEAPDKVLEVSKEVKEKTKEIKQSLKEAEKISEEVDVSAAKKLVKDTSLTAVEAVVQKKEEGKVAVPDEEVKKMLKEEISDILDVNPEPTDAETEVEATSTDGEEESAQATSSLPSIYPSTDSLAATSTALDAATSSLPISSTTIKDIAEANDLVDNNHLVEAIQKIKEINEDVAQVEEISKQAGVSEIIDEKDNGEDDSGSGDKEIEADASGVKEESASSTLPEVSSSTVTEGNSSTTDMSGDGQEKLTNG